MSLFRKRRPQRPIEFEFMPEAEWEMFNDAVERALRRLRLSCDLSAAGQVRIEGRGTFGLLNLAQTCFGNDRSEWDAIVVDHFQRTLAALSEHTPLERTQLRVRLLPDDFGDVSDCTTWLSRPYAESVIAAVAVDLPTTVRVPKRADLAVLGLTDDELWELAWAQTRVEPGPEQHEKEMIDGARVHSIFDPSFFTASKVQFLPDLVGPIGQDGALVSIPRRHTILAHVISDSSVVAALQMLIPSTRGLYAEGPGSVSAHIYWWRNGRLDWLPVIAEEGRVEFHPPQEFIDLLARLGA